MLKTKSIHLDLKSLDEKGTFSGYASKFGVKDHGGDIVVPGAFTKSLARWKESGRSVPTLWQHKTSEPIGSWTDLQEDDSGLLGKSVLWLEDAPYARIAHKGMQTKTITGLSIGYFPTLEKFDTKANANMLIELDLREASVVTDPMLDVARVEQVKAAGLRTVREFEDFLRDVGGFSNSQAKRIASKGWGAVDVARDESDEALVKTIDLLSSFKLGTTTT